MSYVDFAQSNIEGSEVDFDDGHFFQLESLEAKLENYSDFAVLAQQAVVLHERSQRAQLRTG